MKILIPVEKIPLVAEIQEPPPTMSVTTHPDGSVSRLRGMLNIMCIEHTDPDGKITGREVEIGTHGDFKAEFDDTKEILHYLGVAVGKAGETNTKIAEILLSEGLQSMQALSDPGVIEAARASDLAALMQQGGEGAVPTQMDETIADAIIERMAPMINAMDQAELVGK